MKKRYQLGAVIVAAAMVMSLGACGSADEDSKAGSGSDSNGGKVTSAASDSSAAASSPSEGDVINVTWMSYNLNDDWFNACLTFAQDEAAVIEQEEGVTFNFTMYDGAGDEENQVSQVDDVITKGDAEIIVFEPINEAAMAKAVKKLNDAYPNVPIGADGVTASGGSYLYVGLDNADATAQCGEKMIELLSEKYGEDPKAWAEAGGIIVELMGPTGLKISQDRSTGFHNALDEIVNSTEGLEIVQRETNWDPETALEVMTDVVQRYGDDIIGVFSSDDTSATEGAWRAFELNDMAYTAGDENHIPIVTYDGTMNGMQAVRDGKIDMITEQPAFAYGHLLMRYLYIWYRDGYDALPAVGTTLDEKTLSQYFAEGTGCSYWSPVEVKEGVNWDGIWLAPQSPVIPDEVDAYSEVQWGNYLYYLNNGEYPQKG